MWSRDHRDLSEELLVEMRKADSGPWESDILRELALIHAVLAVAAAINEATKP